MRWTDEQARRASVPRRAIEAHKTSVPKARGGQGRGAGRAPRGLCTTVRVEALAVFPEDYARRVGSVFTLPDGIDVLDGLRQEARLLMERNGKAN